MKTNKIRVPKSLKNFSDNAVVVYLTLCACKINKQKISIPYLMKVINSSRTYVDKILKRLEDAKLIKRNSYFVHNNGEIKRVLSYMITPVKEDYVLVDRKFFTLRIDSNKKGIVLKARMYCWDDSLRFMGDKKWLCKQLRHTESYIDNLFEDFSELPYKKYFVDRKKRQIKDKLKALKEIMIHSTGKVYKRAKWAFNKGFYWLTNYVLTGVPRRSSKIPIVVPLVC